MRIRQAEPRDIPQLVELRRHQLADEGQTPEPDISDELRRYFAVSLTDGSLAMWVAEADGALIATGAVCFCQLPPNYSNPSGLAAYVTGMYTAPGHRGQGIATCLLGLVVDEAARRGCRAVRLHASGQGRPVYERFGFRTDDAFLVYRAE